MQERLDDLFGLQSDVESCADVDFQLRLATPECGEHPEGDELAVAGLQVGPSVDVAETPCDDLMSEFRRDVLKRVDHLHAGLAVDCVEDI